MLQCSENGTFYVDADLEIRNIQLIVEKAVELCRNFRPCSFSVETNQFQELLAVEINKVGTSRGVKMPMYHIPNLAPKTVRIRKLTWQLAEGRFKFMRNSLGAQRLVQQLRDFPNGEHDDGPDALEMALRVLHLVTRTTNDPGFTLEYGYT
jgi:predicted phage terminase large subunit-like protein